MFLSHASKFAFVIDVCFDVSLLSCGPLQGIDYCHKRGVANRDIKLENTLLQAVNGLPLPLVKICDFGYSKADAQSVAKSKVCLNHLEGGLECPRELEWQAHVLWLKQIAPRPLLPE